MKDSKAFYSWPAGNGRGYAPPLNGTVVDEARDTSDFLGHSVTVYAFAIVTYSHFIHLTRLSRFWNVEALQVLAFACFPALPLVQSANYAIQIILKILDGGDGSFRYYVAALLGFYAQNVDNSSLLATASPPRFFPLIAVNYQDLNQASPPNPPTWKNWKQIGKLAAILASFTVSLLSSIGYIRRLRITYNNATFVAVLGIDHRLGCLELGSFWISILSFGALLIGKGWKITNPAHMRYTLSESSKATVTNALLEIVVAGLIQDMLLALTNRWSTVIVLSSRLGGLGVWVLPIIVVVYVGIKRVSRTRTSDINVILSVLFLCEISIPIIQAICDNEEIKEIKENILWPWNYRWMEKDRLIVNWWVI